MGKYCNTIIMDAAFIFFQQNVSRMAIATAQPASYADFGTYGVGTLAVASANFTLAAGDTSGRKITNAAATIAVGTSGTINHIAYAGTAGSGTLLFVGTCAPTSVTVGGTVVIGAYDVNEINNPA